MTTFSPNLPLWYQLAQMLRSDILTGRLAPGARIMPEIGFAKEHGVSVMPVRQAFRALEEDGLITRQPGRGTFVCQAENLPSIGTTRMESLYSREFERPAKILGRGLTPVPAWLAEQFDSTQPLAFVRRVAFRDKRPWSFGTLYFPADLIPRITTPLLRRYPLYRIMREECGITLVRSHFDAQALAASPETAGHLQLDPSSPVLFLACTTVGADDHVVGAYEMTFPGAPFTFGFQVMHEMT